MSLFKVTPKNFSLQIEQIDGLLLHALYHLKLSLQTRAQY